MTKKTIISRYIWLKIISKTWEPGMVIPSANSLALHLKQSPSSIKLVLQRFVNNQIIICKTRGKCKINDNLYSFFPLSVSDKYGAKCIESFWNKEEREYVLNKIYKRNSDKSIIKSKLTIFENQLSKEHLIYKNIFELLPFLNKKPNYFEIQTKTIKEEGKFFIQRRILVFDSENIIIIEYILTIPSKLFESKSIIYV